MQVADNTKEKLIFELTNFKFLKFFDWEKKSCKT